MAKKPILFNTEMTRAILRGIKTHTRRIVKEIPLQEPYFEDVDGIPMVMVEFGDWYPATRFCRIQPVDILWVRETWFKDAGRYMYRADYSDNEKFYVNGREIQMRWKPSIHMPRDAARLFLRVKKVGIERIQDIDMDGIRAEGLTSAAVRAGDFEKARLEWMTLWNSTINKDNMWRYRWKANPWVWDIEFERIEKP